MTTTLRTTTLGLSAALATLAALGLAAAPQAAHAQGYTLTTLASFSGSNGSTPVSHLTLSADSQTLYGTTSLGNSGGTVFSLPVTGGTPAVLTSFNGANGSNPSGGLTLIANTLYGTTFGAARGSFGTVFSLPVTGGAPNTLVQFNAADGAHPAGDLALSADSQTFYGTTSLGGANNDGNVFSLPVSGGTPTTLADFSSTSGNEPFAGVTLSADGQTLYGTTHYGGTGSFGTVFSVPVSGGAPTTLANFSNTGGGPASPEAGLLILSADGRTLYGTTYSGGTNGYGTVFSIPVGGGPVTVLASFSSIGGDGPIGGLTLSADGRTLYGTTELTGNTNGGNVFSLPVTGGTPNVLVTFTGPNGSDPEASLILGPNGTLYGTTEAGGANNDGTVFALIPNAAPEPSQWASLGVGLLGLAGLTLRARKRNAAA